MAAHFSVVVATLNRGALLRECLNSVFAQTHPAFEVIVVDGGSTDDTPAILASYGDRLKVLHERGQGPGGARNIGAAAATGQYLVFVDSDDVIRAETLALYEQWLRAHGPAAIMLAAFRSFSGSADLEWLSSPPAPFAGRRYDDYLSAASDDHLSGTHRLIIDRELFLSAGGLTTTLTVCEDQHFGLRICDRGPCLVVYGPPTIGYRVHEGNVSANARDYQRGAMALVHGEQAGLYPGGSARRDERRAVITRTARSASLLSVRAGRLKEALQVYLATFAWHFSQRRFKYIVGFPLLVLTRPLRP